MDYNNVGDINEIYYWVDEIPLSRPKKNITRDFSDGVLVAEIMKFFYPKLVDLHNYAPASSKSRKIHNWITLDKKVFSKLNIRLSLDMIERLITANPGTIESLLVEIRHKLEQNKLRPHPHEEDVGSLKAIPYEVLLKKDRELQEKNETIVILKQKISHLEKLIQMKDQRIYDLTS